MENPKIVTLEKLALLSKLAREGGKKVVLCHGTFDLLHTGHIRHLQSARHKGDLLLVTVTADEYVNKGPGRPIFNEQLRAENLAALECTGFVAINYESTAENVIAKIQPNLYAKGSDYKSHSLDVTGNIILEQNAVEAHGGKIIFTNELTFSSSNLLNTHFEVFTQEVKEFLSSFKQEHSEHSLKLIMNSISGLNVLVIGEAIIDEYHYCSPLGQAGKGNFQSVLYDTEERFAGGSIAVANHISSFVSSVTLLSGIGKSPKDHDFIQSKLFKNVVPKFFQFKDAPTITKRRFVGLDLEKFFEVYLANENAVSPELDASICDWISEYCSKFDVVIVPDFGNGFITKSMARQIEASAKFLAVNTQINSGNRGYHAVNKYLNADFISLNEPELRLATHNKTEPVELLASDICKKMGAKYLAVTRGAKGVTLYDENKDSYFNIPALATRVIDRVGAGDAFLSIAGLCASQSIDGEVLGFLGSVAAALDVQIICNRESINSIDFQRYLTTLLK